MSSWLNRLPTDGDDETVYAGDTIKYLFPVYDENGQPYTGQVTKARYELMQLIAGVPTSLPNPVVKGIDEGITMLPGPTVEVILIPTDTDELVEGCYLSVLKVRTDDFGERTTIRRLKMAPFVEDIDAPL
jgi:hypothetical protein